jgi:hypothetical protein
LSGVVVNNGVITSGSWAGSVITAFYGGTGYNSYTKGDILVGAGNTFIKLNVGTDNYVLTASSLSSIGLTWSPTAATGLTTLNGLSVGIQFLSFGYSGTLPAFSSSGSTHTLNIPIAGTGATGLVSTQAQSFAGIKTFTNAVSITDNTGSGSYTAGALTVAGGVGIGGTLNVQGDLNIQGTFTTINSTTITVADKNIELGVVAVPSDLTAEAGGITLRGATNKTINWYSGVGWSSSESWNLASGNTFKINSTNVLSSNTLGTGVIFSSIQTAGIITSGTWSATAITALYGGTGLVPSFTVGDILYANTSSTWGRLTANSNAGYVLASAGSGATPTYINPTTLSVGLAATSTYSNQSGYAITSGLASTSTYSHQSGYAITSGSSNTSGYATTSGFATTAANLNISSASTGTFYPVLSNTASSTSGIGASVNSFFSFNAATGAFGATSVNILSGQSYSIGGNGVLSGTSLGVGVTNSSLTALGTITTGVWAGTSITAFYGGTGYNSYTKGDILVGSGNTFIKLNVGTDNFVLTADASTASGVKWTSVAGLSITSVNGLTASAQFFATGTSGTGFSISSSGSTHTFNIPIAGTGATGLVSTLAQSFAGTKTFTGDVVISSTTGSTAFNTGALTVYGGLGVSGQLSFNQAALGYTGANNPSMAFIGSTTAAPITLTVLSDNSLLWEGTSGKLFGINNNLSSGWIFNVGDISGLPIIRANADGTIAMAEFAANVGIGLSNPSYKLHVLGDTNLSSGYVYRINGTQVLSSTSLGTGVTNSSLTAVGTLSTGVWAATAITALYGGTGLVPSFTVGDILYANTSSTWGRLTANSNSGYVLTSAGSGATPTYVAPSSLSVGFATTSSYAYQSGYAITSGLASTANYAYQSGYAITSGFATTASNLNVANASTSSAHTLLFSSIASGSGVAVSSNTTLSYNPSALVLSVSGLAVTSGTASTSSSTGALVVAGGVGIGGSLFVSGDLTINGTTTTINSVTLTVDDKNIELGSVSSPSDITAEGGGITLKGTSDKFVNWYSGTGWSSSESWNLASGNTYKINNTTVLSSTSLGTGVTNSSLTAVGTISTGVWSATAITAFYGGTGYNSYTKGDILVGSGNTFIKLSVGSDNLVLTASSTSATGLTWSPTAATGITTLNTLTATQQFFATGTSGSGFNISSSGSTHTFNIPIAGSGATGLVSTLAQTIAGQKTFTSAIIGDLTGTATTATYSHQSGYAITSGFATTSTYAHQSGYAITSGTATTAINLNTVAASTNATHYVLFSPVNGGSGVAVSSDSGLTFNPSSNTVSLSTLAATTVNTSTASVSGSTASTSTTSGALIVTGGVGIGGSLYVASATAISGVTINNGVITGNLTGTATTSTTSGFATTSGNINVVNAASGTFFPVLSNTSSSVSGIGASVNSFFSFNASTGAFGATSLNILAGQSYSIGGNSVLSATSLGTGVTNSSLTAVGIISTGTWSATAITARYGGTGNTNYTLGDILVGAGSTFIKLPVGINGYVLSADSSRPSGLGWTSVSAVTVSPTVPSSPKNADLWFNSEDGGLLVYYQDTDTSQWVEIALGSGVDLTQSVHITNTTASTSTSTGALIVDGGVGIQGELHTSSLVINGTYDVVGESVTLATTTVDQPIYSLDASVYRSVKFMVQITHGTDYQVQEILLLQDGTDTYLTQYAQLLSGNDLVLATYDADLNSGNMRLLVTPTYTNTTFKIYGTAVRL